MKISNNMAIALAALLSLAACNSWTGPESLTIKEPTMGEKDPAIYRAYLDNLNVYKQSWHQLLVGWFDNSSKSSPSRAGRLASLPDSVDVVSLLSPDNLTATELDDIATLKTKGTRVIYTIDYESFCRKIEKQIESAADTGGVYEPDWMALTAEFMDNSLALLGKYPYDGVSILYEGHSSLLMPQDEADSLARQQAIIFDRMSAAAAASRDKLFMFEGYPQFVIDRTALSIYHYFAIQSQNEPSVADVEFVAVKAKLPGVTSDRMIVKTFPREVGKDDEPRGIFVVEGMDCSAITELAYWMAQPSSWRKAGLGVVRINDDYYNADRDYKYIRSAIRIMNP
ncbi:hypothetical protein FACS1894159_05670 [Bacteroidia bacterium]|nr:hypothetical protein FACS1894159_05670 [Bacteroidia bacterium]